MKTVYKYPIVFHQAGAILMPEGSEILTLQFQNDIPCLWALVDTERKIVKRNFIIVGTGHEIDPKVNLKYINTFQVFNGTIVCHVFEINN